MNYVVMKGKVIEDESLIPEEIPVILTENGVLTSLVDYFLEHDEMSHSWRKKTIMAVCLLLDFMSANAGVFDEPDEMFKVFAKRLKRGTLSKDGTDPSGLYWTKRSIDDAGYLITLLSEFSDFMADKLGPKPLNPFRQATAHEEQINWAAYQHKKARSFLAHTWKDERGKKNSGQARRTKGSRKRTSTRSETKNFPKDRIFDLLFKGFERRGKQNSTLLYERFNLRNILLTILLHGGGLRLSEPFHLYVHDVTEDPRRPGSALVRIYDPTEGTAPHDLLDSRGNPIKCTREQYLLQKYGMKTRTRYSSQDRLYAGWKGVLLNDQSQKYIQVFWFPRFWGELFWKLWGIYLQQLMQVERHHPFAFVNFAGPNIGAPYGMQNFSKITKKKGVEKGAHAQAVRKIGLIPSKNEGTTPHGHRHRYARWLKTAKLGSNPTEQAKIIQMALHHRAVESQQVYGDPTVAEVTKAMDLADANLTLGGENPALPDMTTFGFEDVDPLGLLSGPLPKLTGGF
jgi:hypothetical protein